MRRLSFKHPSATELKHDFLWRTDLFLPERGQIGIFNRSYYEEVLIVRVHPRDPARRGLPGLPQDDKSIWEERYRSIRRSRAAPAPQRHAHHQILSAHFEGRAAQAIPGAHRRSGEELEVQPGGHRGAQVLEGVHEGLREGVERHQHVKHAPWYIVPADDKLNARLIVSRIVLDTLRDLKLEFPKVPPARKRELQKLRKQLEK